MRLFAVILSLIISSNIYAGLVTESSRIIYLEQNLAQNLIIKNINPYPVLVQSFIDDGAGDPNFASSPFMVNPAVMRINPNETKNITILYTGDNLPTNQETLFWLNLHEIPSSKASDDNNAHKMLLTINTQLKVLFRPKPIKSELDIKYLADNLKFKLELTKDHINVITNNPAAYNASITNIILKYQNHTLSTEQLRDMHILPFSSKTYTVKTQNVPLSNLDNLNIIYYLNDDYGNSHEFTIKYTD